jgi:hypothetical protein
MLKEYKSIYKKKYKLREDFDIVTPIKWSNTYYMSFDEAEKYAEKKNWLVPLWDELYTSYKNNKISDWKPGKYLSITPIKDAIIRGVHVALNILKGITGKKIFKKDTVAGLEKTNVRFIVSYKDKDGNVIKNKGDSFLDRIF